MAILKCKMCGGDLELTEQQGVAKCLHCGAVQTVSFTDDEKRLQLFDRANHFRTQNEFEKATNLYEMILREAKEDCEAYWGIVLCKYGIEYVEDPRTHKRIPTVNRAQFTSILNDSDYQDALCYANAYQKAVYEAEAKTIDTIQKGILEISSKEEPFDVFICYKETDAFGNRTQDSVYAQDIYQALTDKGYRVFFARITLESKLGQQYEPYIFAALNSAKVMLVVGTTQENFNAVWVKNEWSRFLALMKADSSKSLIPCYKDISAYDMPEEFIYLQAQDMAKIGYLQDLTHGISKIINKQPVEKPVLIQTDSAGVDPLLKRAYLFLEDRDWQSANEYCERVLDLDPENAQAYFVKMLGDFQCQNTESLVSSRQVLEENSNYQKALKFADEAFQEQLKQYATDIQNLIEQEDRQSKERIEKQAHAIAQTIEKYSLSKKRLRDSKELVELNKKSAQLISLARTFDETQTALNNIKISLVSDKQKVQKLQARKEKIGVFGAREKKQIEAELLSLQSSIRHSEQRIVSLEAELAGYSTKSEIEIDLYEVERKKEDFEKSVRDTTSLEDTLASKQALTFEQAQNIYLNDEAVASFFRTKYDNLVECLLSFKLGNYYVAKSDTKEPLEWEILETQGNRLLLLSKYAIEFKPFNTYSGVTWESSTLRLWLNSSFFNNAFSPEEQSFIQTTTVPAHNNSTYDSDSGNDTCDKVFILSSKEAKNYLENTEKIKCEAAEYAVQKSGCSKKCRWWLRTIGETSNKTAFVDADGVINENGERVYSTHCAVRPAIWVAL